MRLARFAPPSEFSAAGARIPCLVVRVMFVVTGALLSLADYGFSGWLVIGILFSVLAACAPELLLGWVVILFLAAGQLGRHVHLTWRFLILLAGLHLLHVLSTFVLELPWRSWVAPRVFVRPIQRWVAIQVPTQLLAVVCLLLLSPSRTGHRPLTVVEFAVIGAAALGALALLLLGPRRENEPGASAS